MGGGETHLGGELSGSLSPEAELGGHGAVEDDDRIGGYAPVLDGAKGQHVHAGAPGELGGVAAQCGDGVGEAGAIHVNAQAACFAMPARCPISAGVYTAPVSVAWVRLNTEGCTLCTSPTLRCTAACSSSASILAFSPPRAMSLAPPVKNSGAPHSSLLIWLSRWHNTLPHGGVSAAKLNAFAAEPVETGSRSTSQSKISLKRRRALKVQLSVPWAVPARRLPPQQLR